MTIDDIKKSYEELTWLSDKLAYWSSHDISQLNESYDYDYHWSNLWDAIERLDKVSQIETIIKQSVSQIKSGEIFEHGFPESRLIPTDWNTMCMESHIKNTMQSIEEVVRAMFYDAFETMSVEE
jgi:hypothetical protein